MCGTVNVRRYKMLLLGLLIVANALMMGIGFRVYQTETVALAESLAEEDLTVSFKEAREILHAYGYRGVLGSDAQKRFALNSAVSIFSSIVVYAVMAAAIEKVKRETLERNAEVLNRIEQALDALREDRFRPVDDELASCAENEETKLRLQRIAAAFDGLNGRVLLAEEKAAEDRKATKEAVTDISHQLKTPIAAIRSTFEILRSSGLTKAERREFEDRMAIQLSGLEKLTASLVNISRLESGMIQLELREGRLFDTILRSVNRVWQKANEKKIAIELDESAGGDDARLLQDRKWLTEAFINILDNAIKYSGENTAVTISAVRMNAMVRIEFKDRGIGIPAEEKHRVFQRFFRGGGERVSREAGSGVGLYLARRIISEHGGTIMVKDNCEGGRQCGSVFVVQLPLLK